MLLGAWSGRVTIDAHRLILDTAGVFELCDSQVLIDFDLFLAVDKLVWAASDEEDSDGEEGEDGGDDDDDDDDEEEEQAFDDDEEGGY
jgi:hypothetical protein